jgi:hypothetical protein
MVCRKEDEIQGVLSTVLIVEWSVAPGSKILQTNLGGE